MKHSPAFTLLELLIVVALVGLLSLPIFSAYNRSQKTQELVAAAESFADIARRAHIFSREVRNSASWGIRVAGSDGYELVSQQTGQDVVVLETYPLPDSVQFSDVSMWWFVRGSGEFDEDSSQNQTVIMQNVFGRQVVISTSASGVIEVRPL